MNSPTIVEVKKNKYRCNFPPPNKVWYQTNNGWASREWRPGEKARYAAEVLGQ